MSAISCLDLAGNADHRDPHRRQRRSPAKATISTVAPKHFGPRRERTRERYYAGHHASPARVYVVDLAGVEPLAHLRYRTDAPFAWGESGDGALELAFALLSHAATSNPPEAICRLFCDEVIAGLPQDGFVLVYGQIASWLLVAVHRVRRDWRRRAPASSRGWASWFRHGLRGA